MRTHARKTGDMRGDQLSVRRKNYTTPSHRQALARNKQWQLVFLDKKYEGPQESAKREKLYELCASENFRPKLGYT